jgi:hypothetical protein
MGEFSPECTAPGRFTLTSAVIYTLFSLKFEQGHQLRTGAQETFHAETYIPAEPPPPIKGARLPDPYEDSGRTGGHFPAPSQRAQARFRKTRIS